MAPSALVTQVQTGPLDLAGQALLAAGGALYLLGTHRLSARGRRWPVARTAGFLGGLLAVWVAVGSGLAAYDDTDVTVHVIQHLLLMMAAPPLLVLGRPLVLAMQAAGRGTQVRLGRAAHGRVLRCLTNPVVTVAFYLGAMYVLFTDRAVYDYVVAHPLVHDASHVGVLAVGTLYWEALLGQSRAGRFPPAARVVSILATMPFEVVVGVWLRYQGRPIDPISSLGDTQRAGEAFVVGAATLSTVWLVWIMIRWAGEAIREERRQAGRVPAGDGAWTVPWWVAAPEEVSGS